MMIDSLKEKKIAVKRVTNKLLNSELLYIFMWLQKKGLNIYKTQTHKHKHISAENKYDPDMGTD